ncbi:MAG: DUF2842 domain-containing protein [Hyphomicrobiales bacterium]|nr:DUF2842 domain-containing protein [Hyphomicrobiales bacterium]
MPIRLRKLIGTIVIATFMVFYALLGMTIAVYKLQDTSHMVQLAYYLIVGVFWAIPVMPVIKWMQRPDPE